MNTPRSQLRVEQLDDRLVPATWSVPWDNPGSLSVSFAPDGTDVGGSPNVLAKDLAADGYTSASAWQSEIMRALNTWSTAANVKFRPMWDFGQAFGTQGAVQGDLRFGDIRIASRPLSDDVIALGTPFTWSGTTWSGDIVLNSNVKFSSKGAAGSYDLYSVVLHEAGHALGLEGNGVGGSVMNECYAVRTGLSSTDVTAIQALYGPPQATTNWFDSFRNVSANYQQLYRMFTGSVATNIERDSFTAVAPAAVGSAPMNLIVYVRATNITLGLTPQIAVSDAAGKAVAFEVISNSQGWISVQVRNVQPGATYKLNVFNGLVGTQVLDYSVGVEFNQNPPIQREVIAAKRLTRTAPTETGSLVIHGSRLVTLSLTSTWNSDTNVRMTVTNSAGKVVAQLVSSPKTLPPTVNVFLEAGTYTVKYQSFSPTGSTVRAVQFVAMIDILNDPISTYLPDEEEMSSKVSTDSSSSSMPSIMDPTITDDYEDDYNYNYNYDYTYYGYIDPNLTTLYMYYY